MTDFQAVTARIRQQRRRRHLIHAALYLLAAAIVCGCAYLATRPVDRGAEGVDWERMNKVSARHYQEDL